MLQIKNTLGGGKPEGLYAWKKSRVDCIDNTITKTGTSYTLGNATSNTIVYYSTSYILDEETGMYTLVNPESTTLEYQRWGVYSVEMVKSKYYIWGSTSSNEMYNTNTSSTHTVRIKNSDGSVFLDAASANEIYDIHSARIEYTFLYYVVSNKENTYPNYVVHTDGYYYESINLSNYNNIAETNVSTLPYGLNCGSAVTFNDEIHILGTNASGDEYNHYKWNGSSWTSVSTLPHNFYMGAAVVLNNEIHILGGSSSSIKHYKWDGTSWTSVSTLPYNFSQGCAVVFNGEIHILGSNNNNNHYKWNGSSWTSVSTLPYNFYMGSAVIYNNELHILGCNDHDRNHYKWDGSSWTSVSRLPHSYAAAGAIVLGNYIYIAGSGRAAGDGHAVYKWDGSSWSSAYNILTNQTWNCAAVVYMGKGHLLGDASSMTTHVSFVEDYYYREV